MRGFVRPEVEIGEWERGDWAIRRGEIGRGAIPIVAFSAYFSLDSIRVKFEYIFFGNTI